MKNFRHQHRPKKSSLIVGPHLVREAILSGKQLDRIYLQNTARGELIEEISNLAREANIPVNRVPVEKLNAFNAPGHGGIIAQIARIQYHDLQEIISFTVENGKTPLLLILDGITDIRNIGGIARTAYCTGVDAIVIPDKGVGALQEDAILTSAGALEKIPVCRVQSLMKAVDDLHLNGIRVFASVMKEGKNIFECDFREPCAIIMGAEENGIYPALQKIADEKIKIPMSGDFDSLNVGVATGIILYEAIKQRLVNAR